MLRLWTQVPQNHDKEGLLGAQLHNGSIYGPSGLVVLRLCSVFFVLVL